MRALYFLFPLVLLAWGCDEDSFSSTVDIPLPEHDPLPVVAIDLRSQDTLLSYRIGLSRGLIDRPGPGGVRPRLEVRRDDRELFSVSEELPNSDGANFRSPIAAVPDEPADFSLTLDYPGFELLTARQRMPAPPVVGNLVFERDATIDLEGFRVDRLEFDLADDPATEDYYGFRVLERFCYEDCRIENGQSFCDTICQERYNEVFTLSPDPTLRESYGFGYVVPDKAFNGGTFRVRLTPDTSEDSELLLEVYHLTEDAYRYGLSRLAYENARGNPFAEPVNVHTNVEGGYGYFIVSNRIRVPLE